MHPSSTRGPAAAVELDKLASGPAFRDLDADAPPRSLKAPGSIAALAVLLALLAAGAFLR